MRICESSLWNEVRKDMFSLHTAQKAAIIEALDIYIRSLETVERE